MPTPALELKPTPEAEALYRRWLTHLNEDIGRNPSAERRAETVRDELYQIYLGRPHGNRTTTNLISETASLVLAETFDPRNITLHAEYLEGIDGEKFGPRKPLIWFWRMFDRSPLGLNRWLGVRFRCMLGQHIFAAIGKGVKIGCGFEFAFGYNLTIEDNVRIGRNVTVDDTQPLTLKAGTEIKDGEHVGSDSTQQPPQSGS